MRIGVNVSYMIKDYHRILMSWEKDDITDGLLLLVLKL